MMALQLETVEIHDIANGLADIVCGFITLFKETTLGFVRECLKINEYDNAMNRIIAPQ